MIDQEATPSLNSREWWSRKFATNWEPNQGKEQTAFFMRTLLAEIPDFLAAFINQPGRKVLDWGCALGQGAAELHKRFGSAEITGLDFAHNAIEKARELNPGIEFRTESLKPRSDLFDVIVTSNCLEHFDDPLAWMRKHLACTRFVYIAMVPYKEQEPLYFEHRLAFDENTLPESIDGFIRTQVSVVDTTSSGLWPGRQMTAVYVHDTAEAHELLQHYLAWGVRRVRAQEERSETIQRELAEAIGQQEELGRSLAEAVTRTAEAERWREQLEEARRGLRRFEQVTRERDRAAREMEQMRQTVAAIESLPKSPDQLMAELSALQAQREELERQLERSLAQVHKLTADAECHAGVELELGKLRAQQEQVLEQAESIRIERDEHARALHSVRVMQAELDELRPLGAKVRELDEANRQLVATNERLNDAQVQLDEANRQFAATNERLNDAQVQLAEANRQLAATNERLNDVQVQLAEANERLADRESALAAQVRDAEAKIAELNESLVSERRNAAACMEALDNQIDELVKEAASRNAEFNSKCAAVADQARKLQARLDEALDSIKCIEADRGELKARLEVLQTDLAAEQQRFEASRPQPRPRGKLATSVNILINALSHPLAAAERWRLRLVRFAMSAHAKLVCLFASRARHLQPGENPCMNWYAYNYHVFKTMRGRRYHENLSSVAVPAEPGLVSVVLPVYNGADIVSESIASVLAQTYNNFELIIIDDGSTDATPRIVDDWAARDKRIRVVHQQNQKLPASLSNGFRVARGEFLTWTSDDNRMRPEFLEKLVAVMRARPTVDMVYANVDIINEHGEPFRDSTWFQQYQTPPGSEHIAFPGDVAELNIWPNNYVGSAFMYRARAAHLIGDYSDIRFTTEDYDYWMRVNDFFTLRHAGIPDHIYEYRFHPKSLTSRDKELRITDSRRYLMRYEEFRRDFLMYPVSWFIEERCTSDAGRTWADHLRNAFKERDDLFPRPGEWPLEQLPRLWLPAAHVMITDDLATVPEPATGMPANADRILIYTGNDPLPEKIDPAWDLCIAVKGGAALPRLEGGYRGWMRVTDPDALATCLDIRVKNDHLWAIEREIGRVRSEKQPLAVSAIICTYRRSDRLRHALFSLCEQTLARPDYEILVVNNDPREDLSPILNEAREKFFAGDPDRLRLVICPIKGLSFARNAGISEARGAVCAFIDDDAIARPDLLERVVGAFNAHPDYGVVGGKILLKDPEPAPWWWSWMARPYWSHFEPGYPSTTRVDNWWEWPWGANWNARRDFLVEVGGFRAKYGRSGNDFGGGEEMALNSVAHQVEAQVAIEPEAVVTHDVDPSRFSLQHIRRTILAGTHVNYQLQKDLYIPMQTTLHYTLRQAWNRCGQMLNHAAHGRKYETLEAWYFMRAQLSLARRYLRDFYARYANPVTRRDPK